MEKNIIIRIVSAAGHTTIEQDLATAIQTVFDAHFKKKQWPFVGIRAFQFEALTPEDPAILQDAARLREMLIEESDQPITVTLTGDLTGGAEVEAEKKVVVRITSNEKGHEETIEGLGAALAKVISAHLKNKQWLFVNSHVFQFDEDALNDPAQLVEETQRLHEFVESVDGPVTLTLTGELVGGTRR